MSIAAIMRDYDDFVSALDETLTQLIDVHLYPTQSGEEEIAHHGNHRFSVILPCHKKKISFRLRLL